MFSVRKNQLMHVLYVLKSGAARIKAAKIKLMKASNSTDPHWNEELDDVLKVIALEESGQRSSAVQPAFDEERHFYQDLSTFQSSSCHQRKVQNQYVSTASPRIKVQST